VVWQGSAGDRRPYADQTGFSSFELSGRESRPTESAIDQTATAQIRLGSAWFGWSPAGGAAGYRGAAAAIAKLLL